MTKEGCPWAHPKLTSLPSAKMMTCRPLSRVYLSTCNILGSGFRVSWEWTGQTRYAAGKEELFNIFARGCLVQFCLAWASNYWNVLNKLEIKEFLATWLLQDLWSELLMQER